jgi:hypothetical protein
MVGYWIPGYLTGYRDKTAKIVATLRSDVNDTHARIPLLRHELQDSAARIDTLLCQEIWDSATGLVTSIREIKAIVQDLRAQVAIPPLGDPGPATPATPRLQGASVDPPPMPTPVATQFQLHGGVRNPYRGSDSFPPGNRPPRDTALVTMHDTNQDRGRVATDRASGTSCMSPMRRDPSTGDLCKNPTQITPARPGPHEDGTGDCIVGGPIKSQQPSNKERLAQARGVGLFDIAGLATTEYHGRHHGVQELTILFIHNCGYQSFSNTDSPEDILICFGEIQKIHRKVLQSWYNPRTLVSGPSIACILDKGFQAFPKLQTLDVQDAVKFTTNSRICPRTTSSHSCLLMLSG